MKFAFYTTVFSDLSFEEVAGWAKAAGFDGVEIDFGRHIREPENTATAVGIARETGLEVCDYSVREPAGPGCRCAKPHPESCDRGLWGGDSIEYSSTKTESSVGRRERSMHERRGW